MANVTQITYDLGNAADWASALGTIAAAGLALWLALRERRERLGATFDATSSRLVVIIFNAGTRPIVLKEIGMELGRFRPEEEESIESILAARRLPRLLRFGEDERFEHDLSSHKSYLPDRLYELANRKSRWNRQLYFTLTTGSGRKIRIRVPDGEQQILVKQGS